MTEIKDPITEIFQGFGKLSISKIWTMDNSLILKIYYDFVVYNQIKHLEFIKKVLSIKYLDF